MLKKNADVKFKENGDTLTACVGGEIDHYGAAEVRVVIDRELIKRLPDTLSLDLSGVKFMDSSGLGLILGRYNKATSLGIGFKVENPSESAGRIMSAAGAGRIINIVDTRKDETK